MLELVLPYFICHRPLFPLDESYPLDRILDRSPDHYGPIAPGFPFSHPGTHSIHLLGSRRSDFRGFSGIGDGGSETPPWSTFQARGGGVGGYEGDSGREGKLPVAYDPFAIQQGTSTGRALGVQVVYLTLHLSARVEPTLKVNACPFGRSGLRPRTLRVWYPPDSGGSSSFAVRGSAGAEITFPSY